LRRAVAAGVFGLLTAMAISPARAANSAVIIMYHRFGEDSYPSTNVRIEQFEDHIQTPTTGPYTVLPVDEIVAALRAGRDLPDRTIGISASAWPRRIA